MRSTFGVDLAGAVDLGGARRSTMGLRLGWQHQYADTARPMTAAFAAARGGQFTVYGATAHAQSAVIGLAADAAVGDRLGALLNYEAKWAPRPTTMSSAPACA